MVPVLVKLTLPVKLISKLPQLSVADTTTLAMALLTPVVIGWVVNNNLVATIDNAFLSLVEDCAVKVVFPEPDGSKVTFAFEMVNTKSSVSKAPAPSGHFKVNRNANSF